MKPAPHPTPAPTTGTESGGSIAPPQENQGGDVCPEKGESGEEGEVGFRKRGRETEAKCLTLLPLPGPPSLTFLPGLQARALAASVPLCFGIPALHTVFTVCSSLLEGKLLRAKRYVLVK